MLNEFAVVCKYPGGTFLFTFFIYCMLIYYTVVQVTTCWCVCE